MNAKGAVGQLRKKEKGVALLLCIFALMLITGIAVAMLGSSDTETAVNSNYRETQKAYFAAMGGIQEARVRLITDPTVVPTTMPTLLGGSGVTYIVNPTDKVAASAIAPWDSSTTSKFYDDELCHESFSVLGNPTYLNSALNTPCGRNIAPTGTWYTSKASTDPNTGTAAALDYRWVRITQKENRSAGVTGSATGGFSVADPAVLTNNDRPICWDGFKQIPKPTLMTSCTDPSLGFNYETVYRVASLAVTSTGARRMAIAEVAKVPAIATNAAVDSQDNVTLNGNLFVSGFDQCSCKCGSPPSVANCTSYPGKTCDTSKFAIYSNSTVDNPNSSQTIVAGPNPPIAQNQAWNYDIPGLINLYKPQAVNVSGAPYNITCTSTSCGTVSGLNYGVPPALPPSPVDNPLPDSSYGSCDTTKTPWVGPGCPSTQVTYFPGNVQLTGGSSGNGILIVDGDLDVHGGLQWYGLILVKGVIDFSGGGSDKVNISGAVLAGQQIGKVDNTLGGSFNLNYNACALKGGVPPTPPSVLSIREASY